MSSPATTPAQLGYVAPFFIVRDVMPSLAFYRDRLGFEVTFLSEHLFARDDPHGSEPRRLHRSKLRARGHALGIPLRGECARVVIHAHFRIPLPSSRRSR